VTYQCSADLHLDGLEPSLDCKSDAQPTASPLYPTVHSVSNVSVIFIKQASLYSKMDWMHFTVSFFQRPTYIKHCGALVHFALASQWATINLRQEGIGVETQVPHSRPLPPF